MSDEAAPTAGSSRPLPGRRAAVLAVLALGVAGLVAGAVTWATAGVRDALGAELAVAVAGRGVAPGVTAGAVVVVAAGLALTLAGRWTAPVVGALVTAGGALEVAAALGAGGTLERAARTAAREFAGVDALTGPPVPGAARWVAVVVGVTTAVVGVLVTVAGRRWTADRRHGPGAASPARSAAAAGGPATGGAGDGRADACPDAADDDPAVWDRLSRGEDPT